jgi:GT2 family glycosyltransferase
LTAEIDVIIPSRDRLDRLAACLASLGRQTFGRFRVIVIDDGSRPALADTLPSELGDRRSLLILRNDTSARPAASRNRGIAAGDARFVVFLDDDVVAHPELLARHHAMLVGHPGPVVSIGALLAPAAARMPPWDLWQADRLAREHARLSRGEVIPSWTHLYTGNAAVRRADLTAVGGFDEAFTRQEDMELGFRLHRHGCRFAFEPAALVWHQAEHSLSDWLHIPAANARNDVLMDRLRPDSGRLRSVREDLRSRHWMLRVARRALRHPTASRTAARLAASTGLLLHRGGAHRLALPAFSLVWDLEYNRALGEAAGSPSESA